mmetsp:Transcript_78250/g.253438  ORF Transcript_78250/g.253438 Transcript_78250/m.253438 type:complete len:496 (+) Transcript_78250:83-1570(+)
MKCKGNKKSKRTKLSLKYNIQKRVREHKRRVRKEAKKLGVKKRARKDPGIPNTWPFKAEMLAELEQKKEDKEKDLARRRAEAKQKAKRDQNAAAKQTREAAREQEAARRARRAKEAEQSQQDSLRRTLTRAEVLLEVLDARDPQGCRCPVLEAWAQQNGKRFIFVLSKADLIAPQLAAQWLQVFARVGPVVAVQAEAGREGVRELLRMLGHTPVRQARAEAGPAPEAAPSAVATAASSVGVVGYPGTGKRALCKAVRQEAGSARWLLESVGRLRPSTGAADAAAALHLALRSALPRSSSSSSAPAPLEVVRHFLERAAQQAVMRRYRLPAFEGAEGFLRAYAKARDLKSKRGKDAPAETAARHFLAELSAPPGCACMPPEALAEAPGPLWSAHGADRPLLEAAVLAQAEALRARGEGPGVGALALASAGPGPPVDISSALAEAEAAAEPEVDMASEAEEDSEDGEEAYDEEAGEEEMAEGCESEEEDGDDAAMGD